MSGGSQNTVIVVPDGLIKVRMGADASAGQCYVSATAWKYNICI